MPALIDLPEVAEILDTPPARRPVHWRYVIVQHALSHPQHTLASLKKIDKVAYVSAHYQRTVKFPKIGLRVTEKIRLDADEVTLVKRAYQIFGRNGGRELRWVAEAALISGADIETIAKKTLIDAQELLMFRSIFFDVEPYLECPDLIHIHVLPLAYARSYLGNVSDLGWKLVAVKHGIGGLMRAMHGDPSSTELRTLFVRQQARLMETADTLIQGGANNLGERELAIIAAAQSHWKQGLDSRMYEQDARVASFETFFNEIAVLVNKDLDEAVPLPGKTSAYLPPECEPLLLTN